MGVEEKVDAAGQVGKYKARLVAKGYSEVKGVKFDYFFSHIAKLTSIRVVMSLAATFDLEI